MADSGYPTPPQEPPGGWKNNAQWIGNVEYWSEEMMKLGYNLDDIMGIYTHHIGEPYPKNLKNSILAKDMLFPGADMMYEYDLDHHQKRHYTYNSPETESGQKGPFEWENMDPSEVATVGQYYNWRNDPKHEWMINDSGGHPYQAWLAQWGDKYKQSGWQKSMTPGTTHFQAQDIHGRPGYGAGVGQTPQYQGPHYGPTPPGPVPVPGGGGGLGGGTPGGGGGTPITSKIGPPLPGQQQMQQQEDAVNRIPGLRGPATTGIPGLGKRKPYGL